MKLKRILTGILATALCSLTVSAGEIPSLFHNDEAWYKDGVFPLIEKDGKRFIPADIFTMFDYMSVTTPAINNLLIHNTATGNYVSFLFLEQSALINGTVHDKISVFRDGGVYYVEADRICQELGFTTRLYIQEDGVLSMQICDDTVISTTLNELVQSYYLPPVSESDGFIEDTMKDSEVHEAALIYLFCAQPDKSAEFCAHDILEKAGFEYTLFLDDEFDVREVIRHSIGQVCGMMLPRNTDQPTKELDRINGELSRITRRSILLTESTGTEEGDAVLRQAGYNPVRPDVRVNGGSDPEALIGQIIETADLLGSCTVWLDDCWNTVEITRMLSGLNKTQYRTANYIQTANKRLPES